MAELGGLGHIQPHLFEKGHMGENLPGRAVQQDLPVVHHHHPVALGGLIHVVGDQNHRDAKLLVQGPDGFEDLPAAPGIQHGRGLVHHNTVRAHGNDSRNGHPLLLAAGELMGGVLPVLIHSHRLEGLIHPPADLLGGNANVLQPKGHIFLHNGGDDLVVRVLKDHPHLLTDVIEALLVLGIHPFDIDLAPHGQKDGVKMFGQGGFARAVVSQDRQELPLADLQGDPVQHQRAPLPGLLVAEMHVLCLDDCVHECYRNLY